MSDKHSKLFSPSSYSRHLKCRASVIMEQQVIDEESNEAADRGTVMHDTGDLILQIRLNNDYSKAEKERREKNLLKDLQDNEEKFIVTSYVDWVLKVRDQFLKNMPGKFTEHFEERLSDAEDSFGTIDYGITAITPNKKAHILVFDLKTGKYDVPIENNKQLARYTLLLIHNLPKDVEVASVHNIIFQPKTEFKPKVAKYGPEKVEENLKEYKAHKKEVYRMLKTGVEDSDYSYGDACQWCKAKGFCPTFLENQEKEVLNLMDQPKIKKKDFPALVQTIPTEVQVKIFKKRSEFKNFLDAVASNLLARGLAGEDLGELEVVRKMTSRKWDDSQKVQEVAKGLRKLGAKNVTKSTLIGITDIEKMIGKGKIDEFTVAYPTPSLEEKGSKYPKWDVVPKEETEEKIKGMLD